MKQLKNDVYVCFPGTFLYPLTLETESTSTHLIWKKKSIIQTLADAE